MRRQRRLMNQINVVPYIDVMLVLLVIFMVTAPMLPTGSVDLPSVEKSSQAKVGPLLVEIKKSNQYTLQNQEKNTPAQSVSDLNDLVAKIQQAKANNPDQAVVIAASKDIRYQVVLDVMSELQKNQISKIALQVQQSASK